MTIKIDINELCAVHNIAPPASVVVDQSGSATLTWMGDQRHDAHFLMTVGHGELFKFHAASSPTVADGQTVLWVCLA
jgi:hypothetical protein